MEKELKELQEKKDEILTEVETLARAEYEVARLRMIDNTSRLVGSLLLTICLILVAFAVLAFCAAAAVVALAQCVPTWAACLIVGAFYLLLIPVLIGCGKVLFLDPIVRKMSGFKDAEELKCETIRAEGNAALQRERISGRLRFARTMYDYYTGLAQTAWNMIRKLFKKA
ncbi:MAG: phage holin family protein [Paludibacteraceae bacterium]|nr:phage holin family protein [Paludibacteraceae bacterium]